MYLQFVSLLIFVCFQLHSINVALQKLIASKYHMLLHRVINIMAEAMKLNNVKRLCFILIFTDNNLYTASVVNLWYQYTWILLCDKHFSYNVGTECFLIKWGWGDSSNIPFIEWKLLNFKMYDVGFMIYWEILCLLLQSIVRMGKN